MRSLVLSIFLFTCTLLSSQSQLTDIQIKEKLDSILLEGNLLYRYEKAAWISIDMARDNKTIQKDFFSYLVYHKNDTIRTLILNKKSECIYELRFVFQFDKPISDKVLTRALSQMEMNMVTTKTAIIKKIVEQKIPVGCPDGYGLNMILMPKDDGYKFYIITGANKSGYIPFGNDYLFITDDYGNIQSWKKFHSGIIPTMTKGPNGERVTGISHSHLRKEPLITATDICTFMLYAKYADLNAFQVYSPELDKSFRYRLDKNNIEIVDEDKKE